MRLFNYKDLAKNDILKKALGYEDEADTKKTAPKARKPIDDDFAMFSKMIAGQMAGVEFSEDQYSEEESMNIGAMFSEEERPPKVEE